MTWPRPEDYLDVFIRREWEKENAMRTPGPWRIRELVNGHLAVYGQSEYEAVAPRKTGLLSGDARLIAAAPELLEACKAALKFTQACHDAGVDLDLLLARAIAKVEGDHADTNL